MPTTIRILRLYEFIGPRDLIEHQVNQSIHGEKSVGPISIRATTLGEFPEVFPAEVPPPKLILVTP
jgi:hypothetical protein